MDDSSKVRVAMRRVQIFLEDEEVSDETEGTRGNWDDDDEDDADDSEHGWGYDKRSLSNLAEVFTSWELIESTCEEGVSEQNP